MTLLGTCIWVIVVCGLACDGCTGDSGVPTQPCSVGTMESGQAAADLALRR